MNYYTRYYKRLLKGERASPRGMDVSQTWNTTFTFIPGMTVRRRGDNPAIGFIETAQFFAGVMDHDAIKAAAPHARLDLFGENSAYGPRTVGQFERVIRELSRDPYSRRAVVMIARPDDTPATLPCTLTMQFQLIGGLARSLCAIITMRSSDAIWGLPYDMTQFGGIVMALANCLHVVCAPVIVNIGNAHVYDATRPENPEFDEDWSFSIPNLHTWPDYVEYFKSVVDARYDRAQLETLFNLRRLKR